MTGFRATHGRLAPPSRARVALFLSLLLLFFGVALFSPLHQHTLGKSNSCSFNNLEHQMVSLAEAAAVLAPLAFTFADAPAPVPLAASGTFASSVRDRAPPALS